MENYEPQKTYKDKDTELAMLELSPIIENAPYVFAGQYAIATTNASCSRSCKSRSNSCRGEASNESTLAERLSDFFERLVFVAGSSGCCGSLTSRSVASGSHSKNWSDVGRS